MEIKQEVERLVKLETEKRIAPIRALVEKELNIYLSSKTFRRELKKWVVDYITDIVSDDGIERFIPEKQIDILLRKSARSVLK